VSFEFSQWRDDAAWQARLAHDSEAIDKRLNDEQREVLVGVAASLGAESDLDIYFEAENLTKPFNRVDAARHYQVFGMPSGALADELREGRVFGQRVVANAMIFHDNGAFRRLLIHVDEGRTARL
jgi:hypothetical protein